MERDSLCPSLMKDTWSQHFVPRRSPILVEALQLLPLVRPQSDGGDRLRTVQSLQSDPGSHPKPSFWVL